MRRANDEIGFVGRLAVSLLGLFLMAGLWSDDIVRFALGVVGLLFFVAATGLVELAMALWYRHARRTAPR